MKRGLGMKNKEIGDVFTQWNKGVLDSFLIEITRDIMYFNDDDGTPLLEKIMDSAGQKGTGKWTAINALDLGMPVTLIAEAVLSRCLSSIKDERTRASKVLEFVGRQNKFEGNKEQFLEDLEQALYASKIISYRSEEHTSELQSRRDLVCRLLLEKIYKAMTLTSRPPRGVLRPSAVAAQRDR